MVCECGHQLKDHDWNFEKGIPQPCLKCSCKDFKAIEEWGVFVDEIDKIMVYGGNKEADL